MAKGTIKVSIDLNNLRKKFQVSATNEEILTEINSQYALLVDPWTPFKTGEMATDINVDKDGVHYNMPYAPIQHNNLDFKHTTTYHPLATAHWEEVAMQTELPELKTRIMQILIDHIREG